MGTRRSGAAGFITSVTGPQQLHRRRQTLTIALMDSRTGRLAGQWQRRPGAAESMARAATTVLADVHLFQHLHHLIAMLDLPIGSPVGQLPKKPGVAPMQERWRRRAFSGASGWV